MEPHVTLSPRRAAPIVALLVLVSATGAWAQGSLTIDVPNGHVYWNDGDFITTAFTPPTTIEANWVNMACLDDNNNDSGTETFEVAITTDSAGNNVLCSAEITNNFRNTGGCDMHRYGFDIQDVTLNGGVTYYLRTKVLAGAEVRTWGTDRLYYDGGYPNLDRVTVDVPNGHVYWNNGDFITTSFSLPSDGTANYMVMICLDDNNNDSGAETFEVAITTDSGGNNVVTSAEITNNFRNTGGCDRHLYLFDFLDTPLNGGVTYYLRTKVLGGAEVRTWGTDRLYYTAAAPDCDVSPTALNFGDVDVGQSLDLDFTITNTGGGALTGTVSETCDHYSLVSGSGAYSLGAGESQQVTVRFEPTAAGPHACQIDTGTDCDPVDCTGTGLAITATILVNHGSTPTIDGAIGAGEYDDAGHLTFATEGGDCDIWYKHDGGQVYFAWDLPAPQWGSAAQVFLDTDHDAASVPQLDDYRLTLALRTPPSDMGENQGTGSGWTPWGSPVGWTGAYQQLAGHWQCEFAVPYAKLGITAGTPKTLGVAFCNAWTSSGDHYWPTGATWNNPSTWGDASSPDSWQESVGWRDYGHRYAIVVMGGNVTGQHYLWYWGDTSGMYTELLAKGFGHDDIFFLSYGDSANAHPTWVDMTSTTTNITSAYLWAATHCTSEDLLYVYWVDHGSPTAFMTHDGQITHVELGALMALITARQIIGAYNPCYSGAVIDDISRECVISVTSQDATHPNSWGWAGMWRRALRNQPGDGVDANLDGVVSMREAYDWIAPLSQAAGEHSMYDDNGDGMGCEWGTPQYDPLTPGMDGYRGNYYALDGWLSFVPVTPERETTVARHLMPNYPNPFNPRTTIDFVVPRAGYVRLSIHDPRGRITRVLVDGHRPAGTHTIEWNGRDELGRGAPSGVYFLQFQAGEVRETQKMVLLR